MTAPTVAGTRMGSRPRPHDHGRPVQAAGWRELGDWLAGRGPRPDVELAGQIRLCRDCHGWHR